MISTNGGHMTILLSEEVSTRSHLLRMLAYDNLLYAPGTAGCVLASRLSEDPDVSVLLVEAGKTNEGHFMSHMPLGFTLMFKTAYDWAYETLYEPKRMFPIISCVNTCTCRPEKALRGRTIYWPRCKILGGSRYAPSTYS